MHFEFLGILIKFSLDRERPIGRFAVAQAAHLAWALGCLSRFGRQRGQTRVFGLVLRLPQVLLPMRLGAVQAKLGASAVRSERRLAQLRLVQ